jgi:excisionase family DNA binding protein
VTFEENLGALLEAKLAPLEQKIDRLRAETEAMRRALPSPLVSVPKAAEMLGVSVSTIRRLVARREIPSRRFGKTLRVDASSLRPIDEAEVAHLASVARGH